MKLTCDACKLTLNARDEDRGKSFTCPICRGPLREPDGAAKPAEEPKKSPAAVLEWSGGTLDDLVYMVNSQALAAVIEIQAPDKKGEVHVIAGGVDEAYVGNQRGDEAMAALRKFDGAKFRVELRLPSDAGNMNQPNPDRGDLKGRPLAKLMRYCEEYVLTCDLEAWRGNETCRVEYRRGNIARTLINGIDAPEQLADVMSWTSGNFRFVLPRLALTHELDQASRAQAKAAAETRIAEQKAARKTIFGMPAAQIPGLAQAAATAAAGAPASAGAAGGASSPVPAQKTMFMGSPAAPAAQPPPAAAPAPANPAAARTMIGMPMMTPTPATNPTTGAPQSSSTVVIDSAYAAASAAPAPARTGSTAPATSAPPLGTTARGYQPVAQSQPSPQTAPPAPRSEPEKAPARRETAEPERAREKPASRPPRVAQRKSIPPEKVASPWVNVGIAVAVAVGIVLIWLLATMLTK
jgi:hypothetical protein